MNLSPDDCGVLNAGSGAWAFEPLAAKLADTLGIDVCETPRRFNYLLHVEDRDCAAQLSSFIPISSIRLAADKRLLAANFRDGQVPTPKTVLLETFAEVLRFLAVNAESEWCLKYPTSCGANGHRMLTTESVEPPNWPRPFVVQEFIRLDRPEVFRTYGAGAELFGWVTRRFPEGSQVSPWVAHARGARYVRLDGPPPEAMDAARQALAATGLLSSFGCVDLLHTAAGKWVVLEVGTDGLFNHVDRELDDPAMEAELFQRIARAFWWQAEMAARAGLLLPAS